MPRQENFWWLIGYNMGRYNYEGMYWDEDENGRRLPCQYLMVAYDECGKQCESFLMDYKTFKEYISGYDLTEIKKVRKQAK